MLFRSALASEEFIAESVCGEPFSTILFNVFVPSESDDLECPLQKKNPLKRIANPAPPKRTLRWGESIEINCTRAR